MIGAVLRGDLRARAASRKMLVIEVCYLGILGVLVWLGVPPELSPHTQQPEASLTTALLVVQAIIVAYCASACATQEIAIEGEKSSIDLLFVPFAPLAVVAGKSLATLATVAYWLVLGAPFVILAAGIRQDPVPALIGAGAFIAVLGWSVGQMGLWLGAVIESEVLRTLAHWALLTALFAGTLALPAGAQWLNPVVALNRMLAGPASPPFLAYAAFGLLCDGAARQALRRYEPA